MGVNKDLCEAEKLVFSALCFWKWWTVVTESDCGSTSQCVTLFLLGVTATVKHLNLLIFFTEATVLHNDTVDGDEPVYWPALLSSNRSTSVG